MTTRNEVELFDRCKAPAWIFLQKIYEYHNKKWVTRNGGMRVDRDRSSSSLEDVRSGDEWSASIRGTS